MRFHCEDLTAGEVVLGGVEGHHLTHVLRLGAGAEVELFDGRGGVARAVVKEAGKRQVRLLVQEVRRHAAGTSGRVAIAVSVAKGQRFDQVITQCTELGVDHIVPVVFERTVRVPRGETAGDRWKKLAVAAAKQCGRVFVPEIAEPASLLEALSKLSGRYPHAKLIYGGFSGGAVPILSALEPGRDVTAFVGPEGGLTEAEEDLLRQAGYVEVRLTETTLRIETAAVALAGIVCTHRDAGGDGT